MLEAGKEREREEKMSYRRMCVWMKRGLWRMGRLENKENKEVKEYSLIIIVITTLTTTFNASVVL